MTNGSKSRRGTFFPIVEANGFPYDSRSSDAHQAWEDKACPFAGGLCEKQRQYNFGYCSVSYAAKWDNGERQTYAVCDHRLDGPPAEWAMADYFGDTKATLVPEVTATGTPKRNIDYIAFTGNLDASETGNIIAIETQTIDLRGGGVGPAWEAWKANDIDNWRAYFTAEAKRKNRKDTVDYGVNTGNVYKRLGTQVAEKGTYLKQVDIPLYVIMQNSIFRQLRERVQFTPVEHDWDITFAGFDYDGTLQPNGQLALGLQEVVRTTLENYVEAMARSGESGDLRADFIERVKKKAKVVPSQTELLF